MTTRKQYAMALHEATREILNLHTEIEKITEQANETVEVYQRELAAAENYVDESKDTISFLKNDLSKKDDELKAIKEEIEKIVSDLRVTGIALGNIPLKELNLILERLNSLVSHS